MVLRPARPSFLALVSPARASGVPFLLGLATILAGVILTYRPVIEGTPLNWDDGVTLSDPILGASPSQAVATAFASTWDTQWWPLFRLSWWAQDALLGLTPPVSHGIDLALFATSVVGLAVLLRRAGLSGFLALLAVALWALHPLRVESVAWLTARKGLLSLVFLVGSALALAPASGRPGKRRILASVALFAAALLSKSVVAPVAGVFAVWVWSRRGVRAAARESAGHLAAALVVACVAFWFGATGPSADRPDAFAAVPLHSHAHLMLRWIWPTDLAAIYPEPDRPWPLAVAGLVALVCGTGGAIRAARRGRRGPVVLVALWALPLLPAMGPFPLAFWGADRYSLIPSLAPSIGLAWGMGSLWRRRESLPGWTPWAASAALTAWMGVLVAHTAQRVPDWRNPLALWTAEAAKPDDHWARHTNLAGALGAEGRFEEALEELRRAERLAPRKPDVRAHRLFAELVVRGWNTRRARAAEVLHPPPLTPQAWLTVVRRLEDAGEPDLARETLVWLREQASLGRAVSSTRRTPHHQEGRPPRGS